MGGEFRRAAFFFRWRRQKNTMAPMRASPMMGPTTAPAIQALLFGRGSTGGLGDGLEGGGGDGVGEVESEGLVM